MNIIIEFAIRPWSPCHWIPFPSDQPIGSNGDRIIDARWGNDSDEIVWGRVVRRDNGRLSVIKSSKSIRSGYKFIDKNGRKLIVGDMTLWGIEELFGWFSPEMVR